MSLTVQDTIKSEIVFSTTCIEGNYVSKDGEQVIYQISKVAVHPVQLTLSETKTALGYVDKAISVTKGCLTVGAFIFPEVAPVLGIIGGVGSFIQACISLVPEPEEESEESPDETSQMVEKLNELEGNIDQLEKKLNNHFDDLKIFFAEVNFNTSIRIPVSILMRYMRDCMKHRTKTSLETFQAAYEKHPPLYLAYLVMGLLDQKSTNPFTLDTEKMKTSAPFKKWEEIIKSLFGQFLFLEAFASGLINDNNTFNSEILAGRTSEVFHMIDNLKDEYGQKNDGYWEEIKPFLSDSIESFNHLDHAAIADKIKIKLETYLTNDAFYIIVAEANFLNENAVVFKNFVSENQVLRWDWFSINILIYRSRYANTAKIEDLEKLKKDTQELKNFPHNGDPSSPQKIVDRGLHNAGLMILIGGKIVEIRSANCPKRKYGPGWWTVPSGFGSDVKQTLLVGFH